MRKLVLCMVALALLSSACRQRKEEQAVEREFEGKYVAVKLSTGHEIRGTVLVEDTDEIILKGPEGSAPIPRTLIMSIREIPHEETTGGGKPVLPGEDLLKQRRVIKFVAKAGSRIFHKPGCKYAPDISSPSCITFSSREEAIRRGLKPCGFCNP